jgi:hypothetical protein
MYVVCGLPLPHILTPSAQPEERVTVTVVDLDQVQMRGRHEILLSIKA